MFPWILCCILLIVVFFLITKIIFIEKSIDEIHTEFQERLSSDTNTLIDISSSDPHLRKLASEINIQLRLLRKERHRYQQGDLELKEAITNISHDLRTPLTAINGYLDLLEREEKSETVHCYLSQIQNRTDVLKNLTEELVSNHQFNWWFIISPPKGYCYYSPQRAVSQALLLARYKAVLLESSRLDSSACSFIYF